MPTGTINELVVKKQQLSSNISLNTVILCLRWPIWLGVWLRQLGIYHGQLEVDAVLLDFLQTRSCDRATALIEDGASDKKPSLWV